MSLFAKATGFAGKWVAKYLFDTYSSPDLEWVIAGRNPDKLDEGPAFIGDSHSSVNGLLADSADEESFCTLVNSTKVIISTVAPYAYYDSSLMKARTP